MQRRAADLAADPHRLHVARMRRPAVRGAALHALARHGARRCASSATMCSPAVGPVEAVSGYRNPALNACARGSRAQRPSRFLRARPDPAAAADPPAIVRADLPGARAATARPPAIGPRLLHLHPLPHRHAQLPPLGLGRAGGQRKPLRGARARRGSRGGAGDGYPAGDARRRRRRRRSCRSSPRRPARRRCRHSPRLPARHAERRSAGRVCEAIARSVTG